jgi:hypothetical protein
LKSEFRHHGINGFEDKIVNFIISGRIRGETFLLLVSVPVKLETVTLIKESFSAKLDFFCFWARFYKMKFEVGLLQGRREVKIKRDAA